MFDSNVVGTANATTAGWGNLGGGVALEIMGYIYLGFFNEGLATEKPWRAALAVPQALVFFSGLLVFFFTDDFPLGNIRHQHALKDAERKKEEELAVQAGETLNLWQQRPSLCPWGPRQRIGGPGLRRCAMRSRSEPS